MSDQVLQALIIALFPRSDNTEDKIPLAVFVLFVSSLNRLHVLSGSEGTIAPNDNPFGPQWWQKPGHHLPKQRILVLVYCAWPETALLAKCEDRACQGIIAEKSAILTDVEYISMRRNLEAFDHIRIQFKSQSRTSGDFDKPVRIYFHRRYK